MRLGMIGLGRMGANMAQLDLTAAALKRTEVARYAKVIQEAGIKPE